MLLALIGLIAFVIFKPSPGADDIDSNSSEPVLSQSPFEEVAQRVEESRHGVPTGVPLHPNDEHFLKGYEQVGLAIALIAAIGLSSRKFAPRLGPLLLERFDPWIAAVRSIQIGEEKSVQDFAVQLQIVERGNAEMARSREGIVKEFLQSAPEKLANLRTLFAEISRSADADIRRKLLADLAAEMTSLKNRVGSLELTPAWLLTSSLEKLLGQLADKPANITPSTMRTAAGGLLLLNELCVLGVRNDLAARPPVQFMAVDDDPISRRAVSMCLKKIAQAPDIAEHGEAALEFAKTRPYDAIFLDVEMPGLDGFEVCTKLHQFETNRITPVVFVTGHSDFDSRAKSISSGGRDLIAKPFLSAEITVKAITLVLRGRLDKEKAIDESSKSPIPNPQAPTTKSKSAAQKSQSDASATSQSAQKPDSLASKTQESKTSDPKDFTSAFSLRGAEHLRQMQQQVSALNLTENKEERQKILGEIYVGLNMVRSDAARAGIRAICELSSALGKLISKLLEKPAMFTPSTLQAISATIQLLEELAPGKIQPDLANPPVRALVVDDEPLARRAISNALQLSFGKPDNAENGPAALALTQSKIFDVIFLDIMMPEMDGFETCSKIRETKLNGATPIIFVTSHKDTESRDKALDCGGNGFISKPVLPAEIFLTALTHTLRARLGQNNSTSPAELLEEAVC